MKLKTDVVITYTKKGEIKTLSSPYDNDKVINEPIMYNLINKFK